MQGLRELNNEIKTVSASLLIREELTFWIAFYSEQSSVPLEWLRKHPEQHDTQ